MQLCLAEVSPALSEWVEECKQHFTLDVLSNMKSYNERLKEDSRTIIKDISSSSHLKQFHPSDGTKFQK